MKVLTGEWLDALKSEQKGFVSSVRIIESNSDLAGRRLKRTVAKLFPPAVLFGKEIYNLPAFHIELRNFLDSRVSYCRFRTPQYVVRRASARCQPRWLTALKYGTTSTALCRLVCTVL